MPTVGATRRKLNPRKGGFSFFKVSELLLLFVKTPSVAAVVFPVRYFAVIY